MSQRSPEPEKPKNPPPPTINFPEKPTPGIKPPPFEEVNYNEGPKTQIEDSCVEIKQNSGGALIERELI